MNYENVDSLFSNNIISKKIFGDIEKIDDLQSSLQNIVKMIKLITKVEAISIRLHDNGDFPYFVYDGFLEDFILHENNLCSNDFEGKCTENTVNCRPNLECLCGAVLMNNTYPNLTEFTLNGSFWTNSTTKFLSSPPDELQQISTRNYCNYVGYESVALIPIRNKNYTLGLIQLNDSRENIFDIDKIHYIELLADLIGLKIFKNSKLVPPKKDLNIDIIAVMCSYCKKVKISDGNWIPVEDFLLEKKNIGKIRFSHGICHSCLKKVNYSE